MANHQVNQNLDLVVKEMAPLQNDEIKIKATTNVLNLVTHSKVPEGPDGDRLVAKTFPDFIVPCPPDELAVFVLVQGLPEIFQASQGSRQFKSIADCING